MLSRLGALLLGLIWLLLGTVTFIIGIIGGSLTTYPCFWGQPICNLIQNFVLYEVFAGQVIANTLFISLQIVPVIFITLGLLLLFTSYKHLRYTFIKDEASIAALSGMVTAFLTVFLLFVNSTIELLLPNFLERVSASGESIAWLSTLDAHLSDYQGYAIGIMFVIILLTIFMILLRENPPSATRKRFLEQQYQCATCGLVGSGEVPTCILCQSYYRYLIPLEEREILESRTYSMSDIITVPIRISPVQSHVPVRGIKVNLTLETGFEIESLSSQHKWYLVERAGRRKEYIIEGPDYLVDSVLLNINLKASPTIERQVLRVKEYKISIAPSTHDDIEREPDVLEISLERDRNRAEQLFDDGSKSVGTSIETTGKLVGKGFTSGKQIVGKGISASYGFTSRHVRQRAGSLWQHIQRRFQAQADTKDDKRHEQESEASTDDA